jgi:Type I phosphodiesterase / nucleotide pyrophosphatase
VPAARARRKSGPPKLVLCVIDGLKPSMLERAVESGRAPILGALLERGLYIDDCIAAFPSVTPVCAASIVTGTGQDEHLVPSMNWYHRGEARYVEYGSSFRAAQRFGIARQLTDTVYNMNRVHLSPDVPTVFELLDDADVRTAGTTYLMYRGRHRHEPQRDTALTLLASTLLRHPVLGPREFFYADVFASQRTGCRSQLGMPGMRDRHSGCVSAYMVEHDLFDFLLLSLPDNDWHSHKNGPHAQVDSIAEADRQLARVADAGGGVDAFLAEHAVIVMADHSHATVERTIQLEAHLGDFVVLQPSDPQREEAEIAVCPAQRAALVYVLLEEARASLTPRIAARSLEIEGVDLVMWMRREDATDAEGVIASRERGELRFAPGGEVVDLRGRAWSIDGDLAVLDGRIEDGCLRTPAYPDALARVWSALDCPTSGDVALSAAPGYEFLDWGGQAHVGGGSHGSLHSSDSLGALVLCGTGPQSRDAYGQWAIRDITPIVARHFGVTPAPARWPGATGEGSSPVPSG